MSPLNKQPFSGLTDNVRKLWKLCEDCYRRRPNLYSRLAIAATTLGIGYEASGSAHPFLYAALGILATTGVVLAITKRYANKNIDRYKNFYMTSIDKKFMTGTFFVHEPKGLVAYSRQFRHHHPNWTILASRKESSPDVPLYLCDEILATGQYIYLPFLGVLSRPTAVEISEPIHATTDDEITWYRNNIKIAGKINPGMVMAMRHFENTERFLSPHP